MVYIQTASEQLVREKHIQYNMFMGKTLSFWEAEIEMEKELFKYAYPYKILPGGIQIQADTPVVIRSTR